MAEWLKTCAADAQDLGSLPTHSHGTLQLPMGSDALFWTQDMHVVNMHTCRQILKHIKSRWLNHRSACQTESHSGRAPETLDFIRRCDITDSSFPADRKSSEYGSWENSAGHVGLWCGEKCITAWRVFHEKGFHQVLNGINSLCDASKLFLNRYHRKDWASLVKGSWLLVWVPAHIHTCKHVPESNQQHRKCS